MRDVRARSHGKAAFVGDGVSDLEAKPAVDLFIGFGGVVVRPRVKENADLYVTNLRDVLPTSLMTNANFFVPGPTWVRPEILQEMTRPMIAPSLVRVRRSLHARRRQSQAALRHDAATRSSRRAAARRCSKRR